MEKNNQRKIERAFQKALAIEYAKGYCKQNNLSVEKLQKQRFTLVCNECSFEQPIEINSNEYEYVIDGDPEPQVTLIITYENEKLQIEETKYTKEYLGID